MEQTFVLKNVAYAAKKGGGTITGVKELHLLEVGAVAFFANGKVVAASDVLAGSPLDTTVSFAVGYNTSSKDIEGTQGSRIIARFPINNIIRNTISVGVTPVNKVMSVYNFQDTIGEGTMTIYRKGLDVTYNLDRFSVSLFRREGESMATFLARMVEAFNKTKTTGFRKYNTIATAEVVQVSGKDGIKFTAKDANYEVEVSTSGIFEYAERKIDVERVLPFNTAKQVFEDEQKTTPMLGDSGIELGYYFNRVTNVDYSVDKYDALSFDVQRQHTSPINVQNSMVSIYTLYGTNAQVVALNKMVEAFRVAPGK